MKNSPLEEEISGLELLEENEVNSLMEDEVGFYVSQIVNELAFK